MAALNKTINTVMSEFVAKIIDDENKHLQRHAVSLINDLKPL